MNDAYKILKKLPSYLIPDYFSYADDDEHIVYLLHKFTDTRVDDAVIQKVLNNLDDDDEDVVKFYNKSCIKFYGMSKDGLQKLLDAYRIKALEIISKKIHDDFIDLKYKYNEQLNNIIPNEYMGNITLETNIEDYITILINEEPMTFQYNISFDEGEPVPFYFNGKIEAPEEIDYTDEDYDLKGLQLLKVLTDDMKVFKVYCAHDANLCEQIYRKNAIPQKLFFSPSLQYVKGYMQDGREIISFEIDSRFVNKNGSLDWYSSEPCKVSNVKFV